MTAPTGENAHHDEACIKLFTDLMVRLNEINVTQMQDILDIAIAAADAANSMQESPSDLTGFTEKISALVDHLRNNSASLGAIDTSGHPSGEHDRSGEGAICSIVADNINIAMQNALSAQQALNEMAISILGKGANLILSGANPAMPSNT